MLSTAVESLFRLHDLNPAHLKTVVESFHSHRPAYHNELHCYSTVLTFDRLALTVGVAPHLHREGLIAALYHDAAHGSLKPDSRNIEASLLWLRERAPLEGDLQVERIEEYIRDTTAKGRSPKTTVGLMLHEADILQTVKGTPEENSFWQACLSQETGRLVTAESSRAYVSRRLHLPESKELMG